jgi:hypothetical protein
VGTEGLFILLLLCFLLQANNGYAHTGPDKPKTDKPKTDKPKTDKQEPDKPKQELKIKLVSETAKSIKRNESNMVMVVKGEAEAEFAPFGVTVGARVEVKGNPSDNSAQTIYGGFIRGYGAEVVLSTDALTKSPTIDVSYTVKKERKDGNNSSDKIFMKLNPSGEISNVGYEFNSGPDDFKKTITIIGDATGKITASGKVTYNQHISDYTVWSSSANFSTDINTGATTFGGSSNVSYKPNGDKGTVLSGGVNFSTDNTGAFTLGASTNFTYQPVGEKGGNFFFNTTASTKFSADGNNGDNKIMFDFGFNW